MSSEEDKFENIWEILLSRQPVKVLAAYESLAPDQKKLVREHLEKMINEAGWQPEQRISAQAALDTISSD